MPKFSDFKKLGKRKTRLIHNRPEPYTFPTEDNDPVVNQTDDVDPEPNVAEPNVAESGTDLVEVPVVSEDPAVTLAKILVDALQLFIVDNEPVVVVDNNTS